MARAQYPGPPEALARYEDAVAACEGIERKGAKNPYTSRNGHMFSFLDVDGHLAVRLAPDRQEAFGAQYESGPVTQHGRTMQDYVSVPDELLANLDELVPWLRESHEWIGTLAPKPTKRS